MPVMKIFLTILVCLGFVQTVHATTSCNPEINFLGFSQTNSIYYEVTGGGDCVPFKALYAVDLQSKKIQKILEENANYDEPSTLDGDWPSRKVIKTFAQKKNQWFLDHHTMLTKPITRVLPKSCKLGEPLIESEKETGMHPKIKRIKHTYFNVTPPLWVVISTHCTQASWAGYTDQTCPTIDHLSVYKTTECIP